MQGSKLKGKARREMLQKRERLARNRQARNELGQRVTSKRLSLTGRVLPGDKTAEVKAGPPAKYFGFARVSRCGLCPSRDGRFVGEACAVVTGKKNCS